MPSLPNCRPRSTAARTSASTSFPFLPSPTKTGVPISASGACGGRVASERCPVLCRRRRRGELSRDARTHSLRAASTAPRAPAPSSLNTNFFHAIASFSKIHVHSWLPACKIARELLQLVVQPRMPAAR